MAKNLNDRISTAVWSPLEYTLFGLITDNLGEDVTVRVSSPYVRDISNKQFRPQGVLGGVLSTVERRRCASMRPSPAGARPSTGSPSRRA